ncbi:MAG: hypothetical protein NVS3B24_04090 [Candidatus Dormibacteria bacterium]
MIELVGHNPGPFSPAVRSRVGDAVTYWDDGGASHRYTVSSIVRIPAIEASMMGQDGSYSHLVLITCAVPDGSVDWVVLAAPTLP